MIKKMRNKNSVYEARVGYANRINEGLKRIKFQLLRYIIPVEMCVKTAAIVN